MVFQDFDQISERRKLERKQKLRKRIGIGVIIVIVFVGIFAAAAVTVSKSNGDGDDDKGNGKKDDSHKTSSSSSQSSSGKQLHSSEKLVKILCNSTTYKDKCESTLKKAIEKNPKSSQPKDLLKAAILATLEQVHKASSKSSSFKFESPEAKGAYEDCKSLIEDAKDELADSASVVGKDDLKKLAQRTGDLNSWLSAVVSYHQTCVDGFPDGKLKDELKKNFQESKEFTSNSLAIVSEMALFLSTFELPTQASTSSRHLLSDSAKHGPFRKKDEFPSWLTHEDRRILKPADEDKPTPNVTVAKDGSGNFTTINEALKAIPAKYEGRYLIFVKQGIYDETVVVDKKLVNVTIYGDGSQKSIITGRKNFVDGVRTFQTATFVALGDGFTAKAMGFRNTAGPEKHQAVAARIQADRSVFVNCRFEGYQDTLYAQTHRQFYRSCVITGTVDFIFGDAAAVFQNCLITVRKPLDNQQNIVTAQGRTDQHETTGIVLQNCKIEPDKDLVPVKSRTKSYLGRPWKEYSRTIVMESEIADFIQPEGWMPWEGDFALKTLYYAEYANTGPGAKTTARVKWPGYKVINKQEAEKFTVGPFLQGTWLNGTGVQKWSISVASEVLPCHTCPL